ncbi:MAG: SUMF1/EgtB/PvdO family nonheme iron enzyme, partial [Pseudomonadota bacterium]
EAPAYFIAKYPVTNAQFQAFVDAPDGYHNAAWWSAIEKHMGASRPAAWREPNAPRERVSWFEAIAFARWANETVVKPHSDWIIGLPSDAEWRQAYTLDGDDYPWEGEPDPIKHANVGGSVGRTSVVGLFPGGASVSNALDMAGNVRAGRWDLHANLGNTSISDDTGFDHARVLRGGSWGGLSYFLRASYRGRNQPVFRGDLVGFRVLCRPHR